MSCSPTSSCGAPRWRRRHDLACCIGPTPLLRSKNGRHFRHRAAHDRAGCRHFGSDDSAVENERSLIVIPHRWPPLVPARKSDHQLVESNRSESLHHARPHGCTVLQERPPPPEHLVPLEAKQLLVTARTQERVGPHLVEPLAVQVVHVPQRTLEHVKRPTTESTPKG